MINSNATCSYCSLEVVDHDDPQHGLCHTCLTEHSLSWAKMDRFILSN